MCGVSGTPPLSVPDAVHSDTGHIISLCLCDASVSGVSEKEPHIFMNQQVHVLVHGLNRNLEGLDLEFRIYINTIYVIFLISIYASDSSISFREIQVHRCFNLECFFILFDFLKFLLITLFSCAVTIFRYSG